MFGSGILDTVIGLIFVFLLVSMLVTIMNEMIAAFMMSRAKWLHLGIERLVGSGWMQQVYAHPLIEGTAARAAGDGPSYIPSRAFANVLMSVIQENAAGVAACRAALQSVLDSATAADASLDSLNAQLAQAASAMRTAGGIGPSAAADLTHRLNASAAGNTPQWLGELDARLNDLDLAPDPVLAPLLQTLAALVADGVGAHAGAGELRTRFDAAIAQFPASPAVAVLREELTAMGRRLQGPYTVGDARADIQWFVDGFSERYVRQMLDQLPDLRMRQLLLTLFEDAKGNVDRFREHIEVWFNNGMDRVNGWYKRRSQWVLAALALGTAIFMNVDAILIFRHLQTYSGTRDAIVAQATQFAAKNPPPARNGSIMANGGEFRGSLPLIEPGKPRSVTIESDNPDVKVRTSTFAVDENQSEVPFIVSSEDSDKAGTAGISAYLTGDPAKLPVTGVLRLTLAPSLPGQFHTVQENLEALSMPIGWTRTGSAADMKNGLVLPGFLSGADVGRLLLQHGLGWLLTALAATLGAPFWFDMLNRIISIRAAGKPPEEEPKPPRSVSVPVEPGQSQQEADRIRQKAPRRQ